MAESRVRAISSDGTRHEFATVSTFMVTRWLAVEAKKFFATAVRHAHLSIAHPLWESNPVIMAVEMQPIARSTVTYLCKQSFRVIRSAVIVATPGWLSIATIAVPHFLLAVYRTWMPSAFTAASSQ